jgi:hypothetical protein
MQGDAIILIGDFVSISIERNVNILIIVCRGIVYAIRNGFKTPLNVTNALADSYVPHTTFTTLGGAAEMVANRKMDKYAALAPSHNFQPLAFETLGPIDTSDQLFLVQCFNSVAGVKLSRNLPERRSGTSLRAGI